MRRSNAIVQVQRITPLPRGWIVLGAALASWALFIGLAATLSQLFALVLSAV